MTAHLLSLRSNFVKAIVGTSLAAPIVVSVAGSLFSLSMFAGLIALVYYGGVYYAVPRWALKLAGQAALNRH